MSSEQSSGGPKIGEICWLDIPIKDSKRALPFYQDVFDWECKDAEGEVSREPGVLKRFFFSKGKTNGCFQLVEPENFVAPSLTPLNENKERWAVITSFAVEGIDDTLAKVERAGGNVYHPKAEIGGDMGYYARFVDTEGNVHGIWSMQP